MLWVYNERALEGFAYDFLRRKKRTKDIYCSLLKATGREVWSLDKVEKFCRTVKNGEFKLQEDGDEYAAVKGLLYCQYNGKVDILDAYNFLQENGCTFTFNDVQIIYDRIKFEKYCMLEERREENQFQFFKDMPVDVMVEIVEKLDLKSRLEFRRTCHACQDVVDDRGFYIKCLSFFNGEGRFIISGSDILERYRKHPGNVWMVYEEQQIRNNSYKSVIRKFNNLLSLILFTNSKIVIGDLRLEFFGSCYTPFSTILNAYSDQRAGLLKVEKLELFAITKSDVPPWINACAPKKLKQLVLRECCIDHPDVQLTYIEYNCKELLRSLNWAEFQTNWNDFRSCWIRRTAFLYVINAEIEVKQQASPSAEQILALKDLLLQNTELCQIEIRGISNNAFEATSQVIGTYNLEGNNNPVWVEFDYPQPDKKLEMCVTERLIIFRGPGWVEKTDSKPDGENQNCGAAERQRRRVDVWSLEDWLIGCLFFILVAHIYLLLRLSEYRLLIVQKKTD